MEHIHTSARTELLEPRRLLSGDLPPTPPDLSGISYRGNTLEIVGTHKSDRITVTHVKDSAAAGTADGNEHGHFVVRTAHSRVSIPVRDRDVRVVLRGGAGDDTLRVFGSPELTVFSTVRGGGGNDHLESVETIGKCLGEAGDDTIVYTARLNSLRSNWQSRGGAGKDTLVFAFSSTTIEDGVTPQTFYPDFEVFRFRSEPGAQEFVLGVGKPG